MSARARFDSISRAARSGLRRWLRALVVGMAFAYPLALAAIALGFSRVGERWWVTAAGLYAPRLLFAIPLPLLVAALLLARAPRFLWTQLVAAVLVLFPLMGLVVSRRPTVTPNAPTLRVLSFNVDSAAFGAENVAASIALHAPDVVMLEESPWGGQPGEAPLLAALRRNYAYVVPAAQFIVASRYPLVKSPSPQSLHLGGRARMPLFERYEAETPIGKLALFAVHPTSPRGVLHVKHFRAALHQVRTGGIFVGDPEADVSSNAALRSLQIGAATRAAATETLPVLLAGDTNLPGLSAVARESFAGFTDGFGAAGNGFGYTYPSTHPFLRLDRILVSDKLRFVSFQVDCEGVSDHLCVVAEVQASP